MHASSTKWGKGVVDGEEMLAVMSSMQAFLATIGRRECAQAGVPACPRTSALERRAAVVGRGMLTYLMALAKGVRSRVFRVVRFCAMSRR
jgi:hypothetical protein